MNKINLDLNESCNYMEKKDHIIYKGKEYKFTDSNIHCDNCILYTECCKKLQQACHQFYCVSFKSTVNNFDLLSSFLPESKINNEFYHIQILKRKKENSEIGSNSILINDYYIRDQKDLNNIKEEIILLCKHYNARAYINLNVRDKEQLVLPMIRKLTSYLENKEFSTVQNIFANVCDSKNISGKKLWIIDIDDNNEDINKIIKTIDSINPEGSKLKGVIPTIDGWHLITTPFNSNKFKKYYPNLDIKKNNATLLYYDN